MSDLVDACVTASDAAAAVRVEIIVVAAELFGEFNLSEAATEALGDIAADTAAAAAADTGGYAPKGGGGGGGVASSSKKSRGDESSTATESSSIPGGRGGGGGGLTGRSKSDLEPILAKRRRAAKLVSDKGSQSIEDTVHALEAASKDAKRRASAARESASEASTDDIDRGRMTAVADMAEAEAAEAAEAARSLRNHSNAREKHAAAAAAAEEAAERAALAAREHADGVKLTALETAATLRAALTAVTVVSHHGAHGTAPGRGDDDESNVECGGRGGGDAEKEKEKDLKRRLLEAEATAAAAVALERAREEGAARVATARSLLHASVAAASYAYGAAEAAAYRARAQAADACRSRRAADAALTAAIGTAGYAERETEAKAVKEAESRKKVGVDGPFLHHIVAPTVAAAAFNRLSCVFRLDPSCRPPPFDCNSHACWYTANTSVKPLTSVEEPNNKEIYIVFLKVCEATLEHRRWLIRQRRRFESRLTSPPWRERRRLNVSPPRCEWTRRRRRRRRR